MVSVAIGVTVAPVACATEPPRTHELKATAASTHWGYYDATTRAALRIRSGDTVRVQTLSNFPPERLPGMGVDEALIPPALVALAASSPERMGPHILTGPIHVEGAAPGDALQVDILEVTLSAPYAINGFFPGKGFLPERFPGPKTRLVPLDLDRGVAEFGDGIEIPLRPFFGSIGVAPPLDSGRIHSGPPSIHAGNLDNKELVAGTTLYIPVHVAGALLSIGDGHAAQGDGEVNLTALETPMDGAIRVTLHKGMRLTWPRAESPTHFISIGLDEELTVAARIALEQMIDFLIDDKGMEPDAAYALCSVALDLRITQVVDGTKGVHGMLPKSIFAKGR